MQLEDMTLLYCEDQDEIATLMKDLLEDEVAELYVASNGLEGLQLYQEHHPDIVLSDIYMPKMSGLEMAEQIKEDNPEQPIILLTAFSDVKDLKRAIAVGIDNYINKPIQSEEELNEPLNKVAKRISDQQTLKALSEQIMSQSKLAAIGEVLGHITHQWKQPLAVIAAGITEIKLQKELGLQGEQGMDEFLEMTEQQINYLSQTIADFRDYLRPKEHSKSFTFENVLKKVQMLVNPRMKQNSIEIMYPEGDITLHGYENKLVHVLVNLIQNAKDILVERQCEERWIQMEVKEEGETCIIKICDSGGGISDEALPHIFDPYFTTKPETIGTGLGLYMSKEFIVGHMCGQLNASNETIEHDEKEITGACFTVTIPLSLEGKE